MATPKVVNQSAKPAVGTPETERALEQFLVKSKAYLIPAVISVVVIMGIVLGVAYKANQQETHVARAYNALHQALAITLLETTEQEKKETDAKEKKDLLSKLITDYELTPAAIDAKFHLAGVDFDMGNYQESASAFAEFQQQYPEYQPLSTSARLAEANCYLAQNKFGEAKEKFRAIAGDGTVKKDQPQITEQATFQVALCGLLTDDIDGAKEALNDLLASSNDDLLKQKSQSLLAKMELVSIDEIREAINPADDPPVIEETSDADEQEESN